LVAEKDLDVIVEAAARDEGRDVGGYLLGAEATHEARDVVGVCADVA
jgi:hypothetical protein